MDFATITVIVLRILIPISILRYPLGGFIASILIDGLHAPLIDIIGKKNVLSENFSFNDFRYYHLIDKWLDLYFLFLGYLASFKFQGSFIKETLILLLFLRTLGVIFYSFTNLRYFLFFFPNVFEFFYLYCVITQKWFKEFIPNSLLELLIVLIVLGIPKLIQEYFFHVKKLRVGEIINFLTPFKIPAPTIWQWFKKVYFFDNFFKEKL